MTNLLNLKVDYISDGGAVVRYKDFVVVASFVCGPAAEWFEIMVYQPIETEEETGEEFWNLRLELVDANDGHFDTEGEALMAGFQYIDSL